MERGSGARVREGQTETRRESREGQIETRRESVIRDRDGQRVESRRESAFRDRDRRVRDRDDDRWFDRRRRDRDDDDDWSVSLHLGPFSAYYGRPWLSYWGPWAGFYGPTYGAYGPWSGSYGYGWPYYYDAPIYEGRVYSSYYDPDDIERGELISEDRPNNLPRVTPEGTEFQRRAEEAFRAGGYDEAVRWANHAAVEMPRNGRLFLFLSQALFAVGDFAAAAGAAHQGMAFMDPNDWGTIVKNFRNHYGDAHDYTEQLRRLERFVSEHSDAPHARFLLGYHYGFLGYPNEARRELDAALELESRDELAAKLLEQFGGQPPPTQSRSQQESGADQTAEPAGSGQRNPEQPGSGIPPKPTLRSLTWASVVNLTLCAGEG